MEWPLSGGVSLALATIGGTVALIALFSSGLGTLLLGGVLIAVAVYVLAVVVLNIHGWATTIYKRQRYRRGGGGGR